MLLKKPDPGSAPRFRRMTEIVFIIAKHRICLHSPYLEQINEFFESVVLHQPESRDEPPEKVCSPCSVPLT